MSAPDWKLQAALNAALVKTTQSLGIFVADDGGRAVVNVFDNTITCRYATRYKPRPGEGVVLEFHGNMVRLIGPTAARSKLGTVTVVGHPYLTVVCDGRTYTGMPYTVAYENSGAGPVVGDTVAIDWDGGYVTDKVTATPTDAGATPKLTTDQKPFALTFFAKQSGSYDTSKNKWVTRDLYTDSSHEAAWFYGDTIHRSLKNDAYISSVEIYLSLRVKQGVMPSLGKHSDATEQSGGVSSSSTFTTPHWTGWVHLPVAWGEDWRANQGGVTISGGSSIYRGLGTDRQSGKLRIRGRQ